MESRVVHSGWLQSDKSNPSPQAPGSGYGRHCCEGNGLVLLISVNQHLKNSGQAVNNSDYSMVAPACSCMLVQHGLVVHTVKPAAVLLLKPLAG